MFLDWKNLYCKNDYTTQNNLQVTNGIFHRLRAKNFIICMETEKIKLPIAFFTELEQKIL